MVILYNTVSTKTTPNIICVELSVVFKLFYLRSELSQSQANKSHRNVINKGNVWFFGNSVSRILSLFLDKENLARDPNQKS